MGEVKDENYGYLLENPILWEVYEKSIQMEDMAWGNWGGGGCVFVGGVDNPMHTMKSDALLHKTSIKIKAIRLDMCTSMITLSKIAHQVWCNQPFSQINKTT